MSTAAPARKGAASAASSRRKPVLRGGIDLGGTKIQAAVVAARGKVLGDARHPTPTSGGPEDVAAQMAAALVEAAEKAGTKPADLAGVGVGSPGTVDERTGAVSNARNLPGWDGSFPLGERLSEQLGTGVRVGNDVQVATDAEARLGAGRPYKSLLGVFWGTGVGGGLVLKDKPWLGRGAVAQGQGVAGAGGCRRVWAHGRQAGRGALSLRAARLYRGLRGPGGDGGQGAQRPCRRQAHGPFQ